MTRQLQWSQSMMHLLTNLGKWQGLGGSPLQWHRSIMFNTSSFVLISLGPWYTSAPMKPVKQALPHSMLPQPAVIDTKPARMPQLPFIESLQTAASRQHLDFLYTSYVIYRHITFMRIHEWIYILNFKFIPKCIKTCIALFRAQTALCKAVACVIPQAFSRPIKRHKGPRLESHLTLVPSGTKRPDALWSWYSFLVYLVKPNLLETWTFCRPANLALARLRASTANWIFSSLAKGWAHMSTKAY